MIATGVAILIGAAIAAPAIGDPSGADCSASYTNTCPGCGGQNGELLNCCNTVPGGCCDRMCRRVTCNFNLEVLCPNTSNYAAGVIVSGQCSGERCEP
jgi:hypothetical protein